jgi:hypothetical protein
VGAKGDSMADFLLGAYATVGISAGGQGTRS